MGGNSSKATEEQIDYGEVKNINYSVELPRDNNVLHINNTSGMTITITIKGNNNKIKTTGLVSIIFEGGNNNVVEFHNIGNILFKMESDMNIVNVYNSDNKNSIRYNDKNNVVNFITKSIAKYTYETLYIQK